MDRFLEWAAGKTLWFLLLPAFVVCFFSLAVPIYLSTQPGPWQLGYDVNGSIGDFFGGIMNPIIALMALVWLVKGVRLQQKELEETRVALQASEKHQAAQVRIAAMTALLASINDEHDKLRTYRQTLEPELDRRLEEHERQQSQTEPWVTLSLDEDTDALLDEVNALTAAIEEFESQRAKYISDLKEILLGSSPVAS